MQERGALVKGLVMDNVRMILVPTHERTFKSIFTTNDIKTREFVKSEGVPVVSLQAILKALWKKKIKSKEEVKQILETIKDTDNLALSREVENGIFKE